VKGNLADPTNPVIVMRDRADPNEIVNDMGWQFYPHGFYNILTQSYQRYKKPIFVLENGTADQALDDVGRQRYIVAHIREVWLAINQGGADVRSYMQWSLIDNFEWANGFDAKFGLESVDYEHDFKRTPRKSAALYSEIAHLNGLSGQMLQKYGVR
jgi:beta-glucosidase